VLDFIDTVLHYCLLHCLDDGDVHYAGHSDVHYAGHNKNMRMHVETMLHLKDSENQRAEAEAKVKSLSNQAFNSRLLDNLFG
jgi:hypothetical protein